MEQLLKQKYPGSTELYNILGINYFNNDRKEEAAKYFRKVTMLSPESPDAFNNLGAILEDLGQLRESKLALEKALVLKPGFPQAHNNLGNVFQQEHKFQRAITEYEKAIHNKPDFTEAYNNLGNTLFKIGEYQEAKRIFLRIIELDPNSFETCEKLAALYQREDEGSLAISYFEKALEIRPHEQRVLVNMFQALIDEDLSKALSRFHAKWINNPNNYIVSHMLGQKFEIEGSITEAIKLYKFAISNRPSYYPAVNNLAIIYSAWGYDKKACEVFENAIEALGELKGDKSCLIPFYSNAGNIFLKSKEYDLAKNCFDIAYEINPEHEANLAQKLLLERIICNWPELEKHSDRIKKIGMASSPVSPFTMLTLEDTPDRNKIRTKLFAKQMYTK